MKISQTVFDLQSGHEYMVEMAMLMFIGQDSKSRQTRITVHVFCMSSHGALHLCDIS